MFGIVVGLIKRQFYILEFQFFFGDDGDLSVDPDGVIHSRYEEYQADVGIGLDILVRLEEPVAGHIRKKNVFLIQHFNETGFATFGGGVATAILSSGGHDGEGRVLDELLNVRSQVCLELGYCAVGGSAIGIVVLTIAYGLPGGGRSCSRHDSRLQSLYRMARYGPDGWF